MVILGTGLPGRLKVQQQTLDFLEKKDVKAQVLKTEVAVLRYNELREAGPVRALLHTTC